MVDNVIKLAERPTDGQLVAAALSGAGTAKRALFDRYVTMVAVQDSFIGAFTGLARLENVEAFRGFLASITTRTAIATLRRRKLLTRLGLRRREPVRLEALTAPHTPADVVAELRQVYGVIDEFPAHERVVLLLRRFEELSLEEIADRTGASLATVKRRLARAERLLAQALGVAESER
jgi:RNA polymerase sigma-70 factor, ECF subfamily